MKLSPKHARISLKIGATLALIVFLIVYGLYFRDMLYGTKPTDATVLLVVVMGIMLLIPIAAPILADRVGKNGEKKINRFFNLPDESDALTFGACTEFLGNLALCSFFITATIVTAQPLLSKGSPVLGGLTIVFGVLPALAIVAVSALRFAQYFQSYKWLYIIVLVVSPAIGLVFLNLGLTLAAESDCKTTVAEHLPLHHTDSRPGSSG